MQISSRQAIAAQFAQSLPAAVLYALRLRREALGALSVRLHAQSPKHVLERGYAWISQEDGQPVTTVRQAKAGRTWTATLADGAVDLRVLQARVD
jgi:exodeoxyribonuclease VII large subunit